MLYTTIDLIIDNRHLEAKLAELTCHAQKVDLVKDLENKKAEKEADSQTKSARIIFNKRNLFTRFKKR